MNPDDFRNEIEALTEQIKILSERERAHYTDIMLALKELMSEKTPEATVRSFDDEDDELFPAEKNEVEASPEGEKARVPEKKRVRKATIAKEPESEIFPKDPLPSGQ